MDYLAARRFVGLRFRELRESHGKTQLELARLLSVDRSTISHYENASRPMTAEDVALAAEYFGVSPAVFYHAASPETVRETRALRAFRGVPAEYQEPVIAFLETVGRHHDRGAGQRVSGGISGHSLSDSIVGVLDAGA